MIVSLIAAGKRVGVTANSHKVIVNLLDEVCLAAAQEGVDLWGVQNASESSACTGAAIDRVVSEDRYILGPEVEAFEAAMAPVVDGAHVIGVSSGTDALLIALMALGVGRGDRVVTTPFSFFATAGVVSRLGATPVFVDIEPRSFGLDPEGLGKIPQDGVSAVLPVHLCVLVLPDQESRGVWRCGDGRDEKLGVR